MRGCGRSRGLPRGFRSCIAARTATIRSITLAGLELSRDRLVHPRRHRVGRVGPGQASRPPRPGRRLAGAASRVQLPAAARPRWPRPGSASPGSPRARALQRVQSASGRWLAPPSPPRPWRRRRSPPRRRAGSVRDPGRPRRRAGPPTAAPRRRRAAAPSRPRGRRARCRPGAGPPPARRFAAIGVPRPRAVERAEVADEPHRRRRAHVQDPEDVRRGLVDPLGPVVATAGSISLGQRAAPSPPGPARRAARRRPRGRRAPRSRAPGPARRAIPPRALAAGRLTTAASTPSDAVAVAGQVYGPAVGASPADERREHAVVRAASRPGDPRRRGSRRRGRSPPPGRRPWRGPGTPRRAAGPPAPRRAGAARLPARSGSLARMRANPPGPRPSSSRSSGLGDRRPVGLREPRAGPLEPRRGGRRRTSGRADRPTTERAAIRGVLDAGREPRQRRRVGGRARHHAKRGHASRGPSPVVRLQDGSGARLGLKGGGCPVDGRDGGGDAVRMHVALAVGAGRTCDCRAERTGQAPCEREARAAVERVRAAAFAPRRPLWTKGRRGRYTCEAHRARQC